MSYGNRIFNNAVKKGFYEQIQSVLSKLDDPEDIAFVRKIWASHRLMLIVSELSEGLEAIRDDNYGLAPKSGGLGEELADARIRIEDLFRYEYPGSNFDVVTEDKMTYNESRPYKHGRKL